MAGGGGDGRRREAGEPTGFGDADLDQPGICGGMVAGAGWELPGIAPGCGRVAAGRTRPGGGDGEQRLGAHRQHGVAVEGAPQPDLVLVQACLAFRLLEAFLHSYVCS